VLRAQDSNPLALCGLQNKVHANSATARASPAPNTPAGWSRMAWLGFELDDGVAVEEVLVVEEVPVVVGFDVVPVGLVEVVGRVPDVEVVGVVAVPDEVPVSVDRTELVVEPQRVSK